MRRKSLSTVVIILAPLSALAIPAQADASGRQPHRFGYSYRDSGLKLTAHEHAGKDEFYPRPGIFVRVWLHNYSNRTISVRSLADGHITASYGAYYKIPAEIGDGEGAPHQRLAPGKTEYTWFFAVVPHRFHHFAVHARDGQYGTFTWRGGVKR